MPEQQLTAIILAATERGGMGDDYFENKTRHLLPLADKPLIQHLIETVGKCTQIGKKHIIIEEKVEENEKIKPCEESYKVIPKFGDRIDKDIELVGEDPLTQVGTFAAVHGYINKNDEKEFPLLVLYGDTLVEEDFLKRVVDRYYLEEEKKSRIVWGLIETERAKSNVYCAKQEGKKDCFFDCPQYPKKHTPNNCRYFTNTGIMAISKGAWDKIHRLIDIIHRPSPRGLFTFENIIKQALIFENMKTIPDVGIEIIGVVAPEGQWYEANYPWEILELNKTKILDSVKEEAWIKEKEETISIRKDVDWTEEKEKQVGEKIILVQRNVKFTMLNGARIKGPCVLGKNVEIQDYAVIENSYIGDECKIECHTSVHDSTLVKDVKIHHHAVIENSIIMEHSEIYYHAEILYSIVGKKVQIGSDVKTPCRRLKNVAGEPAYPEVTYLSDIGIRRAWRFGAIIGDYCQIGSGTVIYPGRRVGKRSEIHANCEIVQNVKPHSRIRNKDRAEIVGGG
nr:glucose-1-phosphate thymidylyltransferase [uncultured archaeon GZfos9C4]